MSESLSVRDDNDPKSMLSAKGDTESLKSDNSVQSHKSDTSVKSLGSDISNKSLKSDDLSVNLASLSTSPKISRSVDGNVLKSDHKSNESLDSVRSDVNSESRLSSSPVPERAESDTLGPVSDSFTDRKPRRDKNFVAMISLSYRYVYKTEKLQIDLKRCWDIYKKGLNKCDPYLKVYLMPDKSKRGKRKSQIIRSTFDPVFNKKIEYDIPKAELENRAIYISLWHNNLFGHNLFLGELTIPVDSQLSLVRLKDYEIRKRVNLFGDESESESEEDAEPRIIVTGPDDTDSPGLAPNQNEGSKKKTLNDDTKSLSAISLPIVRNSLRSSITSHKSTRSTKSSSRSPRHKRAHPLMKAVVYCGEVVVALKYVPEGSVLVVYDRDIDSRGEMFVNIIKGLNLTGFGVKGETNAYCKMQVIHAGEVLFKHKTNVVKCDSCPEWNSNKRFENVGEEDLRDTDIELVVWNKVGIGSNIIGKAKITITGKTYDWTRANYLSDSKLYLDEVLNQANNWIELTVPLKPHEQEVDQ